MADLATDIRNYIDERAAPITVEEVLARIATPDSVTTPIYLPDEGTGSPKWRRGVLAAAGTLALAVVLSLAIIFGPRSAMDDHARITPATGLLPTTISGNEESISPVAVPSFFDPHLKPEGCPSIIGMPSAFSVQGSPAFVVWATQGTSQFACTLPATAALTYEGNGLGNGSGIDSDFAPEVTNLGDTPTSVFVTPDWPVAGQWTYVWTGLPALAAYVTYSYLGSTLVWETPVAGSAAFEVPQPYPFETTPYTVWHSSSFPVLSAYDSAGNLIGQVNAPRVTGDDMTVGPTPGTTTPSTTFPAT